MTARRRPAFDARGAATVTLLVAFVIALAAPGQAAAAQGDARDLEWEELMPEGWDPLAEIEASMGDDLQGPVR